LGRAIPIVYRLITLYLMKYNESNGSDEIAGEASVSPQMNKGCAPRQRWSGRLAIRAPCTPDSSGIGELPGTVKPN
jgi:hypothetical protein